MIECLVTRHLLCLQKFVCAPLSVTSSLKMEGDDHDENINESSPSSSSSSSAKQSELLMKEIRPYISRADEFVNVDKKTSYYCRLHAANVGVAKSKTFSRSPELTNLLVEQLDRLEKMRAENVVVDDDGGGGGDGGDNNREFRESLDVELDALHVEKFAYTLFAKADAQDRKHKNRTKKIAKLYYVSANVFEVLRSMMMNDDDAKGKEGGEEAIAAAGISPEIEEKQRYALWRAGEISKAIRLGAPCEDPPETSGKSENFEEEVVLDANEESDGDKKDESAVEVQPPPLPPQPAVTLQPPPPQVHKKGPPPGVGGAKTTLTTTAFSTRAATKEDINTQRPDYEKIASAQTLAKSAVSALGFEDTRTAIEQLRAALDILESS